MVNTLKKIKIKEERLIFAIFLASALSRFYSLANNPVSLSMDEVSIGYNAYSILKTGKDEWGERLPLTFRSVGDYKPPINIYLTVPSIAIFGLNEFGVRFPVALLGSLTVVLFIFLLKDLGFSRLGYLFGGFWAAVSPWHIHFSRGSFEAVTALFFVILGLNCFLISLKRKSYLSYSLGFSFFALSVWSYHAERIFVPLLVVFLQVFYRKKLTFLKRDRKRFLLSLAPFFILVIPFLKLAFFSDAIKQRALSTSIFREQSLVQALHKGNYANFSEKVFDSDLYLIFRHFIGKYLNYYDLRFWFWKGMQFTPSQFHDIGLFYLADMAFILAGIYALAVAKDKTLRNLAIFWFFIGPLAASFTMNEQHPLRALIWLPFFGMAAAKGIEYLSSRVSKRKLLIGCIYGVALSINIIYFADIYFRQFPRFYADAWQYGYKEIAQYACKNQDKYENVYVTDTFGSIVPNNTGLPGNYILFYCKIDPDRRAIKNAGFEKIAIRRFQWKTDIIPGGALIIGSYWDLPANEVPSSKVIKVLNYPSGKPAFVFVDTR